MYVTSALKKALHEVGTKIDNDFDADAVTQFVSKKLFDNISKKSDHELIREAMKSRGRIEKVEGYSEFIESVKVLHARATEQEARNTRNILELFMRVVETIQHNQRGFEDAFRKGDMESKSVQLTYASVVTALMISNSILIANVVDYVNDPSTIKKIQINDGRAKDIEASLPIQRLKDFLNLSKDVKFKKFLNESVNFEHECLNEFAGMISAIAGIVVIGVALLSFVRDIVSLIYGTRQKAAGWLKIQGNLLRMNALRHEPTSSIRKKQEEYAETFYKLSNQIKIESQYAEKSATKDIKESNEEIQRGVESIKSDETFNTGSSGLV